MINYQVGHYYKRTYSDSDVIMFKVLQFIGDRKIMVKILYHNRYHNGINYVDDLLLDYHGAVTVEIDESTILAKML